MRECVPCLGRKRAWRLGLRIVNVSNVKAEKEKMLWPLCVRLVPRIASVKPPRVLSFWSPPSSSLSLSFSFVAFPLQKKTFFFFCWGINLDFFLIQTVSIFFFLNVARLTLFLIKLLPTKSNPRQYIFRLPVCSLLQSVNSGLRTYCLNQLKLHTEPANQHV